MLTKEQAMDFAAAWVEAFNKHDLDGILKHYAEEVQFYSPFVVRIQNGTSGMIQGKEALRQYLEKALYTYPDLHFDLHHVFFGVQSLVLLYTSVQGRQAAETMVLNDTGRASIVYCHYTESPL